MSDPLNNIIETPIRLELIDNKLSLDEENSITEVMENNSYIVKIQTNENLDDCTLVMKRYGEKLSGDKDNLIEIKSIEDGVEKDGNNLSFETIRLITIEWNEDGIDNKGWGVLYYNDEGATTELDTTGDTYKASIYKYNLIKDLSEVPGLEKKVEVTTQKVGEIFGNFTKIGKEDPRETIEDEDDFYRFNPIKFIKEDGTEILSKISSYKTTKNLASIPEAPLIDKNLIVPKSLKISTTKTISFNYADETETINEAFKIDINNFTVDFSSYDEVNGYYYFDKRFSLSELPEEIYFSKKDNYTNCTGNILVSIKFFENDFSTYDFQIVGNISFDDEAQRELLEQSKYYLPILEPVKEQIQAIERDENQQPILDKNGDPILAYEKNDDGTYKFDENGKQIPIYEGEGIVDWKPKKDTNGQPVYETEGTVLKEFEYNLLPEFQKKEINGKLYYDSNVIGENENKIEKPIIVFENGKIKFTEELFPNAVAVVGTVTIQRNSELNFLTNVDIGIDYSGFTYSEESVDNSQFISWQTEENNIYTTIIHAKYLPKYTEKFLLGLVKYEGTEGNKTIIYATDAIEFTVIRSIETITWDPLENFLNQKYVVAKYDSENNLFYETSGDTNGEKVYLSGRENYLFIDYEKLLAGFTEENGKIDIKNLIYKWDPIDGFYVVTEVKNTATYTTS